VRLDSNTCFHAIASRDPRFDGRFFTGVTTTGIYCRPICPARTPRRSNVEFFACAAAAEEAGFRPCLRCRPDAAPGSPAWIGTGTTIRRALRSIEAGALDGRPVAALATSLGVGERHLRRLFQEELGASPLAVALTRRVHFARKLVEETDLSMIDVALASGFGSVRAFNETFRRTFARAPRELRRGSGVASRGTVQGSLVLSLPHEEPYALAPLLAFLGKRAIPGIETVTATSYRRTFQIDGKAGELEVRARDRSLELELPAWTTPHLLGIVARVRRIFDLDADSVKIDEHLARDEALGPLVRQRPGLRVPGAWDGFELSVRAILGQQVSVQAATTLAGRLVARFGDERDGLRLFPSRESVARAPLEEIGLPRARASAIRGLAASTLTFEEPDLEERLLELDGIGPWTASYVSLRMGEPDAFPAGDAALVRVFGKNALARVEHLRPWRGYAALHAWSRP